MKYDSQWWIEKMAEYPDQMDALKDAVIVQAGRDYIRAHLDLACAKTKNKRTRAKRVIKEIQTFLCTSDVNIVSDINGIKFYLQLKKMTKMIYSGEFDYEEI